MFDTKKIKKMITNNKEDKLTYEKGSEVFTFKTSTYNSAGYIVGILRFALQSYEPEFLEFYKSTKTWKPKIVTVRFYLRNKEDLK